MKIQNPDLKTLVESFSLGQIENETKITNGRTNETYFIKTNKGEFIIQRINELTYPNVDALMQNAVLISENLLKKHQGKTDEVRVFFKNNDNQYYEKINDKFYRVCNFVPNSQTYNVPQSTEMVKSAGEAIGQFENDFADFDATKLFTSEPPMHDTVFELEKLKQAINDDVCNRVVTAGDFIDEVLNYQKIAPTLSEKLKCGELPKRVVHNDTKFNNILFKSNSQQALTLIDFDFTMAGTWLYDFGDAIRYACNKAPLLEEEQDLSLVKFNMEYFKAFTEGYLSKVKTSLTNNEKRLLAVSPLVISYELCLRMLSDYLQGDLNFACAENQSNLQRAKVQFNLMKDMEKNYNRMQDTVFNILEKENNYVL